jgi:hypothetical protein
MQKRRPRVQRTLTPGNILLLVLLISIIGAAVLTNLYLPSIGTSLTQGFIGSLAALLAIVSYRYSVKSNIRSSLSQLEPVCIEGYQFAPLLFRSAWRPSLVSGLGYTLDWDFLKAFTTIQFKAYSTEGDRVPADTKKVLTGFGLTDRDFEERDHFEGAAWDFDLQVDIEEAQSDRDGLRIRVPTTNVHAIRDLSTRVQWYLNVAANRK